MGNVFRDAMALTALAGLVAMVALWSAVLTGPV
jgi:hypothetical protein